jgi:hypothetical protein
MNTNMLLALYLEQILIRLQNAVDTAAATITEEFNITEEKKIYDSSSDTFSPIFKFNLSDTRKERSFTLKTIPSRHCAFSQIEDILTEVEITIAELKDKT